MPRKYSPRNIGFMTVRTRERKICNSSWEETCIVAATRK